MHFDFSDDQYALRDAVRDLLARECPAAVVRAAWSGAGGAPGAWSALADMGVLSMMVGDADADANSDAQPDRGLGLDEVDAALVLEAAGWAALPEPIVETALIAAPEGWVTGQERAAVTTPEHPLADAADRADVVVMLAADGVRVHRVENLELEPRTSVDGARRLFAVHAPDTDPVAPVAAAARVFYRGVFGTAAQLIGLADRMISMTVEYAQAREQFGVKIGTFQAIKHHLADARTALEFARPLVYRAAWSLATRDPEAGRNASMAKIQSGTAATLAARVALQCHGAIGYTTEFDLHLFMKRAWALDRAWGDADWHRHRIGATVFAGTAGHVSAPAAL